MKNNSILLISGCVALSLSVDTKAAPINLRDNFFADPLVVFSDDGLTATLVEDSSLFVVLMSNDPSFGKPAVFIPGPDASIMFDYAQETFEALSVPIPEGWGIEALPSDTSVVNKVGTCSLSFKKVGGSLSVQRMFVLNSPYWRVEDYAAVQGLFAGREALNGLTVVLKKTVAKLQNGG